MAENGCSVSKILHAHTKLNVLLFRYCLPLYFSPHLKTHGSTTIPLTPGNFNIQRTYINFYLYNQSQRYTRLDLHRLRRHSVDACSPCHWKCWSHTLVNTEYSSELVYMYTVPPLCFPHIWRVCRSTGLWMSLKGNQINSERIWLLV